MVKIDNEKCIGCGSCEKDCFLKEIEMKDGKAKVKNQRCFNCGHCIAVCPKGAVSTDTYNMDEVKEYNKEEFTVDAENLLNFIKFRRTIRQFRDNYIEKEKLLKIIEAGRFTQTGSNAQNVSYIVVTENIKELKDITYETLKAMGENILNNLTEENIRYKTYAQMWIQMNEEYKKNPKENDKLFFNAPALILTISSDDVNAALASSNMELMTNALGLGTFFSGFFVRAARENSRIGEVLAVEEGKKIVTCMVIGYPKVKYLRTVPRKEAKILWR